MSYQGETMFTYGDLDTGTYSTSRMVDALVKDHRARFTSNVVNMENPLPHGLFVTVDRQGSAGSLKATVELYSTSTGMGYKRTIRDAGRLVGYVRQIGGDEIQWTREH